MAPAPCHWPMSQLDGFWVTSSRTCTRGLPGAIAIIEAAGGRVNEYLVGDALLKGNRVVAGSTAVFEQLESLLD